MSSVAAPLPGLAGVRHREVDVGGLRLHVAEMGAEDAPPLLMVHGWPQNWWCWRAVAPLLSEDFRCVMPDLRGHGWSERPAGGYEKEQLAGDLLGLASALGIERFGYIGHDWGAYAGFLLALREPERVSGLLALSTAHPWPSRHDRLSPRRLSALSYQLPLSAPFLGRALMRAGMTKAVLRAARSKGTFSAEDVGIYNDAMGSPAGARVTVAMYRTFLARELLPLASGRYANARLHPATLLLVGEDDPIARGADLGGYEGRADDMRVERVPGTGHFLPEERPELVAERARALFG